MGVLRYRPLAAVAAVLAVVLQTIVLVLTTAPAQAAPALGLEAGDLVVSDSGHQRVIVHPADGGPDRVLASGLGTPEDLVVTPAGDVIVADSGRAKIVKIPADGGDPEDLNPYQGAWGVSHLALDGAGGVLFTGTGWGGIGRVPLTGGNLSLHVYQPPYPNYTGLGITSDGDIVAVDCCDSSTTRMEHDGSDQRPVPELTYDSSVDPSVEQPRNMEGLTITADDRVIVADTWNDLVWETDGSGGRTSYGAGLDDPSSVALGPGGAVYVADTRNDRVVRISPDRSTQADVIGAGDLLHPRGVAVVPVSPEQIGDAFVGTANGEVVRVRGAQSDTIASGLDPVADLVVRDDGDLVVAAGSRLVEMSGDGSTVSELASLARPVQALALEQTGDLLVAVDDGSGGTDVLRVSADGSASNADASPLHAFTALTVDELAETYAAFEVAPSASVVVQTSTGTPLGAPSPQVSGLAAEPGGSFLVADAQSGTVRRVADDETTTLASGIAGPQRLARDLDGDVLVAASGGDALLAVPTAGGAPTTVAAIDDPFGVAVYVPRPSLAAVADFPADGNVGAPYDGYDFDADDNDGGPLSFRAVGSLPPGLGLDPSTGELSGTPTSAGSYAFRVAVANQARSDVSDELQIVVGKRLQSLTFTSARPAHAFPDDAYTPIVSSDGSTNPVTISIDPGSSTVCTHDAGTGKVTFVTGGVCTILADQAGDADHEDAATAHQDVYVDKFAQTATFTTPSPTGARVGETYAPAATSGTPSAAIAFGTSSPACTVDGDGVVHFEHVGLCRVQATVAGDDRHWPGGATQNINVAAATLLFAEDAPAEAAWGTRYLPTTNYTNFPWIDVDATSDPGVCTMDYGTGEVVFEQPGRCVFFIDVSGDPDYAPERIERTVTVTKTLQTIVFSSLPSATAPIGGTYTPLADGGGSGNPVTFSIAPGSTDVCSLASGVVHLDHAGSCVIRADQAGDATHEPAATVTQTIQVARDPGAVTITSPPATGVVGQRYAVTATTDPAGSPVEVTVTPPGVCRMAGGEVVLDHAGTCDIRVAWAGDADHEAAEARQTIVVSPAATVVELDVRGRTLAATVGVVAPGGGRPAGVVEFSDGATVLGRAGLEDVGGAMTAVLLRPRAAVGGRHEVTARYLGSPDHAAAHDAVAWNDPAITASITSPTGPSAVGWHRSAVTVTFTCTVGTEPLLGSCPGPVLLDGNRRPGRSLTREIVARDGTTAQVVVTGFGIDLAGPRVRVRGAKAGQTYAAPRKLRCVARDRWSGVDACVVTTKRKHAGQVIAYRASAVDRAGNRTVVRGRYRLR